MSALSRHKTIKDALDYIEAHPNWPADEDRFDMPVWEFVSRNLYDHAMGGDERVRGSMNRATRAQKIILDRTVGTRRQGTNPATKRSNEVKFLDLTQPSGIEPGDDNDD